MTDSCTLMLDYRCHIGINTKPPPSWPTLMVRAFFSIQAHCAPMSGLPLELISGPNLPYFRLDNQILAEPLPSIYTVPRSPVLLTEIWVVCHIDNETKVARSPLKPSFCEPQCSHHGQQRGFLFQASTTEFCSSAFLLLPSYFQQQLCLVSCSVSFSR
jgi:hypothetical protein